jgi:hypothetical protein
MAQSCKKVIHSTLYIFVLMILSGCFDLGKSVEDDNTSRSGSGFANMPATSSTPPATTSNSPPVIVGRAPTAATIGQEYMFLPSATDADGDILTFSIANLPPWATMDPVTGQLSGKPMLGDSAVYEDIVVSVSDGSMTDSLTAFSISVAQVGTRSVTLSWTPPDQYEDGTPLMDLAAYKIYFGLSEGNYPNQIRIDNPGVTSYVVDNLTANTYYFVSTSINSNNVESDFSNVAMKVVN